MPERERAAQTSWLPQWRNLANVDDTMRGADMALAASIKRS